MGRRRPRQAIADYRGLVRTAPWLAIGFAFFLTCLAGLPPGLAGLFAKVVVLRATVVGHVTWLAVVAAVNSVIGLAYYLKVAASLFAGVSDEEPATTPTVRVGPAVAAGLALAVAATLVLSVWPQAVLHVPSPITR
jgi:NADH-quinone oxidoreductase subunit N